MIEVEKRPRLQRFLAFLASSLSPLPPLLVLLPLVAEPHVEEGREHEGQQGHSAGTDEVEDGTEAGNSLGHK